MESGSYGAQYSALLVEDDAGDVALLQRYLGESGCLRKAEIARTSKDAQQALQREEFDVCIFDFHSGSKKALRMLEQLRPVAERLPLILITGLGGEEVAVAALRAGAMDYLSKKNLSPDLLNAAVRHAVDLHAKERQRREAQEALLQEKEFTSAILEHSYDGIAVMNRMGLIIYFSPGMTRIFGYAPEEIPDLATLSRLIAPAPPVRMEWLGDSSARVSEKSLGERIFQFTRKGGEKRWCRLHTALRGKGDVVINGQDITSLKEAEARVEYVALHDPLTDLPTRRLFQDRLKQAIAQAKRNQHPLALLYVDLDKFKPVNDKHGHEAGDQVLVETAKRLQSCLRASDTVARIGGDEFVVLLPSVSRRPDVIPVAEKLIAALDRPYELGKIAVEVGASVGAALFPRDGRNMDALLNTADKAMYEAKRAGGRRWCFYEPHESMERGAS